MIGAAPRRAEFDPVNRIGAATGRNCVSVEDELRPSLIAKFLCLVNRIEPRATFFFTAPSPRGGWIIRVRRFSRKRRTVASRRLYP